jgi:hypothetical protein
VELAVIELDFARLRSLVGTTVHDGRQSYRLVEVLADPQAPALVLEPLGAPPTIQSNQYGDPSRRAPRLLTIPLLGDDGLAVNPLLEQFEPPLR